MIENPETGLKKNNRIGLGGATDVNGAIKGMVDAGESPVLSSVFISMLNAA